MELIDRYLQAVGFWLPKAKRDDIIAELSEDIRSQVQDREHELGRKLDEAEVAALLKRVGTPFAVAGRYLPQRHLVGPVLFPIYVFVLKIVVVFCVATQVLVWLGAAALGASFGAAKTGGFHASALAHSLGSVCVSLFCSVGIVTVVFAVIEGTKPEARLNQEWYPLKLPAVRDPQRIPRSSSIFELVFWPAFLAWATASLGLRTVFEVWGTRVTLAPSWRYFFCGFALVALAQVALSAANLFRPRWTRRRALVRLAIDCAGAVLLCALLKAGVVLDIYVSTVPRATTLRVAGLLNHGAMNGFVFAAIVSALIVGSDLWRVFRVGANRADTTARGQT